MAIKLLHISDLHVSANDAFNTVVAQKIALLGGEIRNDEAAQVEAFAQHRKHVGPGHRGRRIVLRDEPAYGHPTAPEAAATTTVSPGFG